MTILRERLALATRGNYALVPVALLTSHEPYNWAVATCGVLAVVVGGALALDFQGSARKLTQRRWSVGEPLWVWRAWGALMILGGVMMLVQ
jgi:hypothetical protein